MSSFLKNLSNLAIFFNIACLLINIITASTFGTIDITIPSLRSSGGEGKVFSINIITGVLVIVGAIAVSALIGVQVVSSGLNDTSTGILIKLVCYLIVWFVISGGTLTLLSGLGGSLAWVIYGVFTLFYILQIASGVTTSEAIE